MSSNEQGHGSSYPNRAWDQGAAGEENVPRRPNPTTESRVLSRLRKNGQESQPAQDFSTPPPSVNQPSPAMSQLPPQPNATQSSQQPLTLPEITTQLSVNAKEFVPRAQTTNYTEHYTGAQYNQDGLSVSAREFVPRNAEEYDMYGGNQYYMGGMVYDDYYTDPNYLVDSFNGMNLRGMYNSEMSNYQAQGEATGDSILDRFNHVLYELNMHPGNMEEYLRPICKMIRSGQGSANTVNSIVESLFEQSIQEPNFRYTGARICQFLNSNLKDCQYFSGFNKIFITRCQKDYQKREDLKNGSADDQARLRGLAMFMAEIFLNVEAETDDGKVQRLHFLPKILIDFVQTLLSKPTDLDVKCSCQLLKLSGALIEDIVKNSPEQCMKFEETFSQLQSLKSSSDLSDNAKFLVGSVIQLKENNWNRSTQSPPEKYICSFKPDSNNFQAQEPVFYNDRGAPCTRTEAGLQDEDGEDGAYVLNEEEEAAFLEWQKDLESDSGPWNYNDTGYDSYQLEESGDDGGMGDEVEAAYEEFLQEQTYMQGYQSMSAGPSAPQMPPMQQMYNQPPPSVPPQHEYYGHQQGHPPQMGPGRPQNHMPQQPSDPQQPPYHYNDRYHYHR